MDFILISIIIGIFIGALTNALAIKMLFRPYKPWKLGKWIIPFTPGLIPKRRNEIALQLGHLVENYLFTAVGLKAFIEKSGIKDKLFQKGIMKLNDLKNSEVTIGRTIDSIYGDNWRLDLQETVEQRIDKWKDEEILQTITLEEIVNNYLHINVEDYVEKITDNFIYEIREYLRSEKGRNWLDSILESFISTKGMFGFLASKLLEGDQLQQKLLTYLEQTLMNENTREVFKNLLLNEWENQKKVSFKKLLNRIYPNVKPSMTSFLQQRIEDLDQMDINIILDAIEKKGLLEGAYEKGYIYIFERIEGLFKYLSITQVVKEEVENFSLETLEKMILEISHRELKMITYLGGFIGGVIGLIQGLIYMSF